MTADHQIGTWQAEKEGMASRQDPAPGWVSTTTLAFMVRRNSHSQHQKAEVVLGPTLHHSSISHPFPEPDSAVGWQGGTP